MHGKLLLLLILLFPALAYPDTGSIFAVQRNNGKRLAKRTPSAYANGLNYAIEAQKVDRFQYRGYVILLNRLSSGQYEVQAYRTVSYGSKKVNSIFSSQFEASIEYTYSYDPATDSIRREHYIFPPNSLTGWSNPGDYLTMKEFAWKGKYPSRNCSTDIHTSEEYNREYLEASCFSSRDAALEFAKRFIGYVLGNRGL